VLVNIEKLRTAHEDLLAIADEGGFGPPPPGEWDASRLLAHVAATDASIASVALAVAAGQRPAYDNRPSLDGWNLRRLAEADQAGQAGDAGGVQRTAELVRRHGEVLCAVAAQLSEADLAVQVPILIISNGQVVADQPWPLQSLVEGVADVHLPRHGVQLRGLRPAI
jgi:hypothetical protein